MIRAFSSLFHKIVKKVVEEKIDVMKRDARTKNHIKTSHDDAPISAEMILIEAETVSPHVRVAQEIIENGISCKAIPEIGSLTIERKPYYSYLFTSSPRIVTNRGCITIDSSSERNIDILQVIQRN